MKYWPFIALLLLQTGCHKRLLGVTEQPSTAGRAVYVMIGHSNMAGRGLEPSSYGSNPNLLMFGKDGAWHIAAEPTAIMDPTPKVSLGVAFINAITKDGQSAGIVNCGQGGSTTAEWVPGYPLYQECTAYVSKAIQDGHLAGLLIYSGENDGTKSDWKESVRATINGFRSLAQNPNLPVGFVRVKSNYILPGNDLQTLMDQEDGLQMPHVYQIGSEGLSTIDGSHFDTSSLEILGKRFANAFDVEA